jgi:hypothetical protein
VLNYRTSDGLSFFWNYRDYVPSATNNDFSLISVGAEFTDHLGFWYDENQCILYSHSERNRLLYGDFTTGNQNGIAAGFGYPSIRTRPVAKCVGHATMGNYWVPKEDIDKVCPPTLIGFFNGVANSKKEAEKSLDKLIDEFPPNNPAKPIKHDLFYNDSACNDGLLGQVSCLEDFAETFNQRTAELGGVLDKRWEIFWEVLAGRHQATGSLTDSLLSRLGNTASALFDLIGSIFSNILNGLAGSFAKTLGLMTSPATAVNTAAHIDKLKVYAKNGSGMVLVAHSQGNLFVNVAYDGIKASYPNAKVEVVHVAPASATMRTGLNGVIDYALAGIDLVINALRVAGGVPDSNINMQPSAEDRLGHGFVETYMDKTRSAYDFVKSLIGATLDRVSN